MKKLNLQLGSIKEMLTKEQMKNVTGGYGSRCVFYCCSGGPGTCGSGSSIDISCESNEWCQDYGNANTLVPCQSGTYLAALCKE